MEVVNWCLFCTYNEHRNHGNPAQESGWPSQMNVLLLWFTEIRLNHAGLFFFCWAAGDVTKCIYHCIFMHPADKAHCVCWHKPAANSTPQLQACWDCFLTTGVSFKTETPKTWIYRGALQLLLFGLAAFHLWDGFPLKRLKSWKPYPHLPFAGGHKCQREQNKKRIWTTCPSSQSKISNHPGQEEAAGIPGIHGLSAQGLNSFD